MLLYFIQKNDEEKLYFSSTTTGANSTPTAISNPTTNSINMYNNENNANEYVFNPNSAICLQKIIFYKS